MKRFACILIAICFITLSISASTFTDAGFHFTITPLYSYEFGTLNEFVFSYDDDQEYKLSELNWSVDNHSLGLSANLGWKWISIDTAFSFSFPGKSDYMYDSDWQDPSDRSIKTNYSINENLLNKSCTFEIGLSGDIPFTPKKILPVFSASFVQSIKYAYKYYYFSGKNGRGWYGTKRDTGLSYVVPYDSDKAAYYKPGQLFGIDYKREYNEVILGEGLKFHFINRFNVLLNCDFSLYSFIQSLDTHFGDKYNKTGTYFLDTMKDNLCSGKFYSEIDYRFWSNMHIGANYSYSWQDLIHGTTHIKESKNSSYYLSSDSTSGSSANLHKFGFFIRFSLEDSHPIY